MVLTGVGGMAELLRGPDARSPAVPMPVSMAIGLLVMGAGGLYAVKMRRG